MARDPAPDAAPSAIREVESATADLGFDLLGVTAARASDHAAHVRQWLTEGRHGEMAYLAQNVETRLDPTRLLPGAQAIIAVADRHTAQAPPAGPPSRPEGLVARYAWEDDYHDTIKRRLHILADALRTRWPEEQFRSCVDTAPVVEREHAARAGLGWVGKHTLLIHPRLGSWFLLGLIVTTRCFEVVRASPVTDHCGTCTRCIDACPTDCIAPEGYTLDATRCISYLTIEHRSTIPSSLHAGMGAWVAGCDVCQEVCPFNRSSAADDAPSPRSPDSAAPRRPLDRLDLLEVLGWDAAARSRAFRRSALKRIKLDPMRRNALIALGNHLATCEADEAERHLGVIRSVAADPAEAPLVRSTARQVLERHAVSRTTSPPPPD